MSNHKHIATYRGVEYDADEQKDNYVSWWNQIHCDARRWLVYRGNSYRAFDQCGVKDSVLH
jgi:hypothetical protein